MARRASERLCAGCLIKLITIFRPELFFFFLEVFKTGFVFVFCFKGQELAFFQPGANLATK